MSVIIEEVVAETTDTPRAEPGRVSNKKSKAPGRQTAWIERRDLAR
jgi:hypothetical protein